MESKLTTERRLIHRRRPLAIAVGASLLLSAGLMSGCDQHGPQSAAKTPLGQEASPTTDYATIHGGKVIARINGSPLYRENLEVVKDNLGAKVPADRLVSRMVELRLLANKAREEGLEDEPAMQARIQNAIDNQLANAYLTRYLSNLEISDDQLHDAYEKAAEGLGGEEQRRAQHILVKDEDKARELIDQLENGADFAKLAKENSIDTGSADAGGDLGWFSLDQMVKPFSDAVAKLEPGEMTDEPVKTRFGWHIIKLEGVRKSPPPTFDEMRPELEDRIRRQAITDKIDALRNAANVEILTDEVRSMVDRDEEAESDGDTPEGDGDSSSGMGGLPEEPLKALP